MHDWFPVDPAAPLRPKFLVIYGEDEGVEARTLRSAASALGLEPVFFESPAALQGHLEANLDVGRPVAIVVMLGCEGALEVLLHVRGNVRYAATPLLGLAGERTDLAFSGLFECGGDDLVSGRSLRALVSRLRPLLDRAPAPAVARSSGGSAIVATSNLRWRNVVARTLSNVGIEAHFVGNSADAVEASMGAPHFVIASDDLEPDGAARAIELARARGSAVPWLVSAPAKRAASLRESLRGQQAVSVVDTYAPPDNLLFTANELRSLQRIDNRASVRVLFGTAVAFRAAGAAEDDVGFTYNVSTGGLFVRTLAPLESGSEAWLELWPPRTPRVVRLVGRVAWRRVFGPSETATVPPGFGVELVGGLPEDLERWQAGCRVLLADRAAPPLHTEVWQRMGSMPPWLASAVV